MFVSIGSSPTSPFAVLLSDLALLLAFAYLVLCGTTATRSGGPAPSIDSSPSPMRLLTNTLLVLIPTAREIRLRVRYSTAFPNLFGFLSRQLRVEKHLPTFRVASSLLISFQIQEQGRRRFLEYLVRPFLQMSQRWLPSPRFINRYPSFSSRTIKSEINLAFVRLPLSKLWNRRCAASILSMYSMFPAWKLDSPPLSQTM